MNLLHVNEASFLFFSRYAKYNKVNGVEERTLYKAFGIRFDVMVFGQVLSLEIKVYIIDILFYVCQC